MRRIDLEARGFRRSVERVEDRAGLGRAAGVEERSPPALRQRVDEQLVRVALVLDFGPDEHVVGEPPVLLLEPVDGLLEIVRQTLAAVRSAWAPSARLRRLGPSPSLGFLGFLGFGRPVI